MSLVRYLLSDLLGLVGEFARESDPDRGGGVRDEGSHVVLAHVREPGPALATGELGADAGDVGQRLVDSSYGLREGLGQADTAPQEGHRLLGVPLPRVK